MRKLWGGRFSQESSRLMDEFGASIGFDRRLYRYDIYGSIAHARMLGRSGIITTAEADLICDGLRGILADIEAGEIEFTPADEDIHMAVERLLIERIGQVGKKLHTARSRNDQIATDTRLFLKDQLYHILRLVCRLQAVILDQAGAHVDTVMPGYTHLQRAQPVLVAHHFLAYFSMFNRDMDRLFGCLRRVDICPLGSGALAGVGYEVDREFVARLLGFSGISDNSVDAVSDRDYVLEFMSAAAVVMMHLSRLCEELVMWSSSEFGFVEFDDRFSTGSSIMPQKKNPDVAELIRGKTGRVYGHLIGLLTVMKGLPLAYNKDMQEDKEALFDTVDTLTACLQVLAPALASLKIHKNRMALATRAGFLNATDLADYLVRKGVPFRRAHEVTGRLVRFCLAKQLSLEDLSLQQLREFCDVFDQDVFDVLVIDKVIAARNHPGGTGYSAVTEALLSARARLSARCRRVRAIKVLKEENIL